MYGVDEFSVGSIESNDLWSVLKFNDSLKFKFQKNVENLPQNKASQDRELKITKISILMNFRRNCSPVILPITSSKSL